MPPKKGAGAGAAAPISLSSFFKFAKMQPYRRAQLGLRKWALKTLMNKYAGLKKKYGPAPKPLVAREKIAKGEGVQTYFTLRNPPTEAVKVMKKTNPSNQVFRQFAFTQNWDVGRQSVRSSQAFAVNDFQQILNQLPPTDIAGNNNRRFLIDDYTSEVTFANGANASCYVHVYDIMCKTDVDTSDLSNATPDVAWQNGELAQGNSTGYHVIGTDPKRVDLFKEHFKILQVSKHFMKPGDIHKHHIKINYNKILNEARVLNSVRYANVTFFTMIVVYGTPASDDSVPPVCSTTAGMLNVTSTMRYRYRYSLDNQVNNYSITPLLSQPTNLEVVQEDGDIDVVTNA